MRFIGCAFLALILVGVSSAQTATTADHSVPERSEPVRVVAAASALATITGIAISPLLGTGVYGAYKYIAADEAARLSLPWFALPAFFIPALVIAGLGAAKDTLGVAFPPGLKKPLDILEVIENKLSGLIAAGAVIPITMSALGKILIGPETAPPTAMLSSGLATITLGTVDAPGLINLLTIAGGVLIFAVVWMASHAINVLVMLSPWGAVDAALKLARTALLGLVVAAAQFDPLTAGVLSLLILIVAYFLSGWAFRLTVFGSIFCWDFFTRQRDRPVMSADASHVFSSSAMTEQKVPIRTFGRLIKSETGRPVFCYRPWLLFPEKKVEVADTKMTIGRGVFFSTVLAAGRPLFILPPRYFGHEEKVADVYGFAGVEEVGLRKVWTWLKEWTGVQPAAPA